MSATTAGIKTIPLMILLRITASYLCGLLGRTEKMGPGALASHTQKLATGIITKVGSMTLGTGTTAAGINRRVAPAVTANDPHAGGSVMTIRTGTLMGALVQLARSLTVDHVTGMTAATRCNRGHCD